jgi:hypothetical protein
VPGRLLAPAPFFGVCEQGFCIDPLELEDRQKTFVGAEIWAVLANIHLWNANRHCLTPPPLLAPFLVTSALSSPFAVP